MKKTLSVFLAVIMLLGCMSAIAFAADNYTKAYYVSSPDSKKYEIVPYESDSSYVKEGDNFRFTIQEVGSYTMNDTCVIKAASTLYAVESITEDDVEGVVLTPEKVTVIEKDKKGNDVEVTINVYTLANVQTDMYIYVCNIAPESVSGVLDFLNGLFNFFVDFIKWFFGLRVKVIG